MGGQPAQAHVDQGLVLRVAAGRPGDDGQGGDGRGRGQGRRGQFADPVAGRGALGEESVASNPVRGAQAVGGDGGHHVCHTPGDRRIPPCSTSAPRSWPTSWATCASTWTARSGSTTRPAGST